jgi:5-methylcytosine-specific restriction endonuclease McrA
MKYKRPSIPVAIRRELAVRHGCNPGELVRVKCNCGHEGFICWIIRGRQKLGWVQISDLEIDHIKPLFLGGLSTPENVQLLCRACNRRKGWRKHG